MASGDIRFALMSVVPDRRQGVSARMKMLKTNRTIVVETLKQLVDEQDDSSDYKSDELDVEVEHDGQTSEEVLRLEKDVKRVLSRPKRNSSASSDSSESVASLLGCTRPGDWPMVYAMSGTFWDPHPASCRAPVPIRHIHVVCQSRA